MKDQILRNVVGGLIGVALAAAPATAQAAGKGLTGYQEVPALSSAGTGTCKVKAAKDGASIEAELSYSGLDAVLQAHVHLGQLGVNGGISFFFCSNLGNGPVGTPVCAAAPSTVTRTIVAADIIGPASQGIAAGEIAEVIAAIKKRALYCDVHTESYPGGEIRQQLK